VRLSVLHALVGSANEAKCIRPRTGGLRSLFPHILNRPATTTASAKPPGYSDDSSDSPPSSGTTPVRPPYGDPSPPTTTDAVPWERASPLYSRPATRTRRRRGSPTLVAAARSGDATYPCEGSRARHVEGLYCPRRTRRPQAGRRTSRGGSLLGKDDVPLIRHRRSRSTSIARLRQEAGEPVPLRSPGWRRAWRAQLGPR